VLVTCGIKQVATVPTLKLLGLTVMDEIASDYIRCRARNPLNGEDTMKTTFSNWLVPPNLLLQFLAVQVCPHPSVRRRGYLRWISMN
jgi:hypothetical protein